MVYLIVGLLKVIAFGPQFTVVPLNIFQLDNGVKKIHIK